MFYASLNTSTAKRTASDTQARTRRQTTFVTNRVHSSHKGCLQGQESLRLLIKEPRHKGATLDLQGGTLCPQIHYSRRYSILLLQSMHRIGRGRSTNV